MNAPDHYTLADILSGQANRDYWLTAVDDYAAGLWHDRMVYLAANRLAHGDVTATQYGIRVALRPDLGDKRVRANAYWPEQGCRCWSQNARGDCSHVLAALVFRHVQKSRRAS